MKDKVIRQKRDSWGEEWSTWDKVDSVKDYVDNSSNFDSVFEDEKNVFLTKTNTDEEYWKGKEVLDVGCGMGRYSDIAAKLGAKVIAIDQSARCIEVTQKNCSNLPVKTIQANVFELDKSLKDQKFDVIFSIGVIHHTGDTKRAFFALLPYLKENGEIKIWVYRKYSLIRECIYQSIRKVTWRLPWFFLKILGIMVSTIGKIWYFGRIHQVPLPKTYHHFFDWYSCQYRQHHTEDEVRGWYEIAGLKDIHIFGYIGKKYGGAIGASGVKK